MKVLQHKHLTRILFNLRKVGGADVPRVGVNVFSSHQLALGPTPDLRCVTVMMQSVVEGEE